MERSSRRGRFRSTIRWRLTSLYAALFLLTGVLLLIVSYGIVSTTINDEVDREREAIVENLINAGIDEQMVGQIGDFTAADGRTVAEIMAESAVDVRRAEALNKMLIAYAIATPLLVVISLGLGWVIAGRALRPMKQLTGTAQRLSEHNLDHRIALDGPNDEVKRLADTLDAMLARLEVAFKSQRRFAADVSHEIRTPLSIIKAEAEVTLGDAESNQRERRLARSVLDAADRAESLVDSLLALARSESEMHSRDPVDLAELAGDVVGERIGAANLRGVQLDLDLGNAIVDGDPFLLERLVANLVDNGIKYNHETDGWLKVDVTSGEGMTLLEVSNSGDVLRPEDVATITEPFCRFDRGERPGFGLGMTIVRAVAEAHGGRVDISPRPGGGLIVQVHLPALVG